ncbi:zinc ribbon domain-containing protein [uncultured Clostridium sp.]|uniref:zinc ribbon domain-containing protein n=1 Tax=uncultured Clostridium sp. TaxID=59620 RepID=UPI0028E55735|nr:zinc ribbon domain-containing protein [uncultured Clostridium sp.]
MRMLSFFFIIPIAILVVLGAIIYAIFQSTRNENGKTYDNDSNKNPFKVLFYVLVGLVGLGIILFGANIFTSRHIGGEEFWAVFPAMIFIPLVFLIPITILIVIGRFVYYDAQSRGMEPWLWLLVVIFVPNFIGLIIYLVVRSSYTSNNKKCFNCGSYVREDYNICPSCGNHLKNSCSQCGRAVEKGWSMCPYCGNHLS